MLFEDFEGYKKIKNDVKLNVNQILDLLKKYENEIGAIRIDDNLQNTIIMDIDNKSIVDLRVEEENIVIERRLENSEVKDYQTSFEQGKDLSVAKTDRMIEQIYDLLNDYIKNNRIVSEHITSVKKILYLEEEKKFFLGGIFSLGNLFKVKNENGKKLYEVKQNIINKIYIIKDIETKLEDYSLNYEKSDENQFAIIKRTFDKMEVFLDKTSEKTVFKGNSFKKALKIKVDYTDNHYLIELNEIVIGSIDCLDPLIKNKYKIEINNLEQEAFIVAIAIMLDIYNLKNNNKLGVQ